MNYKNYKIKHKNQWYLSPGEGVTDDFNLAHPYTLEEAILLLQRNTDSIPEILIYINLVEIETGTEIPASLIL